jgi:hypothetical protein
MKSVTVYCDIRDVVPKENITRELNWYDPIKREMQFFEGGQLTFKYMEDEYLIKMGAQERKRRGITTTYRMLPVVEELEIRNYKNTYATSNMEQIVEFFNDYANYNVTEVMIDSYTNNSVTFNIPDKEVDDFTYQLERNRFARYRVD